MRLGYIVVTAFVFLICVPPTTNSISLRMALEAIKVIGRKVDQILEKHIKNTQCAKDLRALVADILQRKLWAIKMFDASSKLHPGLLSGNVNMFGNYDECLSIEEHRTDGSVIQGQYCSVIIQPRENDTSFLGGLLDTSTAINFAGFDVDLQTMKVIRSLIKVVAGICIPKSCSIENAQSIINAIEKSFDIPGHIQFADYLCDYKGKPVASYPVDFYIYAFFMVVAAIVIASTLYDIFWKNKGENDYLMSFSLYTNGKKLLSTECENSNLTCVHGIKVICMLWIMHGHKTLISIFAGNTNAVHYFEWTRRFENSFTLASFYAVDCYLLVSGLLIAYVKMQMSDNRKISIAQYYLHRILRIIPALGATVMFEISILKKLSRGPFWHLIVSKLSRCCYHNGWSTMLLLTNFFPPKYQCLSQTWYLSVDSQLYLISPLIVFNVNKHPKLTITGLVLGCILSRAYSFWITIENNLGCLAQQFDLNYWTYIYSSPINHFTPWACGIITGYFLYLNRNRKIKMSKITSTIIFSVAFAVIMGCIGFHNFLAKNRYSVTRAAIFNGVSSLLWSTSLSSIIILCSTGNGGFVNKFLSTPIFLVVSKLTYSMFLIHVSIFIILTGFQKEATNFNNLRHFREFPGDVVLILFASVMLCLMFESPLVSLLKTANRRDMTRKKTRISKATNTQSGENMEKRVFLWGLAFVPERKRSNKQD